MTPQDIRVAALEEAAQIAEDVARGFKNQPRYAALVVAQRIRAAIAVTVENGEAVPA